MKTISKSESKIPLDIRKALVAAPRVKARWEQLTPIARRDFITWIVSAKQTETRRRRIEKACSMLAAGKRRPCCYSIVPMNLYKALGASPKAKARWSELSPTEKRDFIAWIDSEKGLSTERIDKACSMLATGRRLH
jgi:uncharacterized protein YdeI (YjbR/CyaY-like superfamily)